MLLLNVGDNPMLAVAICQQLRFQKASSTLSIGASCVITIMALGALLLNQRTGKNS